MNGQKQSKSAAYASTFVLLLKAIFGAGFLCYAQLFGKFGTAVTACAAAAAATGAFASAALYADVNARLGGENTLLTMAEEAFPEYGWAVPFIVVLTVVCKCVVTSVAYVRVLYVAVILLAKGTFTDKQVDARFPAVLMHIAGTMINVVLLDIEVGQLQTLSWFGAAAVVFLLARFGIEVSPQAGVPRPAAGQGYEELLGELVCYAGDFVFSFNCHHAVLGIQNRANLSLGEFKTVLGAAFAVGAAAYLAVGRGQWASGLEIVEGLPGGDERWLLWLYAVVVITSLIMQLCPLRSFIRWLLLGKLANVPEFVLYLSDQPGQHIRSRLSDISLPIILSILMIIVPYLDAEFTAPLRFVSTTFSMLLCFVYPILFIFATGGLEDTGQCVRVAITAVTACVCGYSFYKLTV